MEATVAPPMYEHNLQQLLAQIEQLLRQSLTVTSSSELGEALDTLPVTKISNDFPSLNSPKEMSQNSKGSSLCALDTRLTPASPVSHAGSGSSHDVPRSPRGTPLSGGVWRESAGPSKLGSRNVKLFGPSVPDSDMSRPSSGLLRKESPDFEVDDSKMNRQVSWMAEKCRVITDMALEAALEMNSTPGEGFEVHHGLQVLSDESGSPRYSCRPSQSTLDHARYGGGQRQRGPSWVEVWAFFGLVFAYCEAVRVPFLAFRGNSLAFLDVASIGFWSMNLVASFCVSERALTAGAVAFVVLECVLLVSTIWYYQGGQHDAVAAVRSLTILRLMYIPGFWKRLVATRLRKFLRHAGREVRLLLNLLSAIVGCSLLLHWLACVWFFVGDRLGGWVDEESLRDRPRWEQYQMAMEFTLARLPPSRITDNMLLTTQLERALAVFATGLALVMASVFTSIVTNDISDIRRFHSVQQQAENQVSDYIRTYPVPWKLEAELKAYLQRRKTLVHPPGKSEMATLLPDFLYRELCRESWSPLLMNHDFLHGLQLRYAVFYTELCVECISDWNLAPQEVLFSSGRKCSNMLFVASGEVFYSTSSSSTRRTAEQPIHRKDFHTVMPSDDLQLIDQTLGPGDWLCEQCLWTPWHYRGRAESLAGATMLCLSDDKLQKAASVHKEVATELVVYARLFVSALNAALSDGLSDLPIVLP